MSTPRDRDGEATGEGGGAARRAIPDDREAGAKWPDGWRLHSAHLERDFATEAEAIGAFVMRPEVEARLEAAFFRIEEPRLQKIVSDVLYT